MDDSLDVLRAEVEEMNRELLALLGRRGRVVQRIGEIKDRLGIRYFDPIREGQMLQRLLDANEGPYSDAVIAHLFKEVFKASADLMGTSGHSRLRVHRAAGEADRVVDIGGVLLGGGNREIIAGPCSVESEDQLQHTAELLREMGVRLLRGGAYKPRTSPYAFQGLRKQGLEILRRVADRMGMKVVTEIVDPRDVELAVKYADVIQVGARNMQNFELLRAVGGSGKPVLLKRGMAATLEELVYAAEYLASEGNMDLILCERGIRTYETWTRNTLDLSAVPILKAKIPFPIVVDLSHATGRRDLVVPLGRAAFAAGADAVMVETHPNPPTALSDADQQLGPAEMHEFHAAMKQFLKMLAGADEGTKR